MARMNTIRMIKIELALLVLMIVVITTQVASSANALIPIVDAVRNVIGPEPIALAENIFYGTADTIQQHTTATNASAYWSPPALSTPVPQSIIAPSAHPPQVQAPVPFSPRAATLLQHTFPVAGEGAWLPLPNAFAPSAAPLMYKTFLHPDPTRTYAQVAIVAMDATRLRLHVVAGTREPVSAVRVPRPGLISSSDRASLVAAFNGGFKAMHGQHGMMVDGQMLLAPQPEADTIALYRDGTVRIAPWSSISDTLPLMQAFRQTPAYLAMNGQINPDLQNEQLVGWGKSVSGKVAIWRSALGIGADGRTLYYAAGESLTAQTLAQALVAAGASDVAELDVNWSFERFMTYAPYQTRLTEQVLLDAMVYEPGMYVSRPAPRDFFYVTLKP